MTLRYQWLSGKAGAIAALLLISAAPGPAQPSIPSAASATILVAVAGTTSRNLWFGTMTRPDRPVDITLAPDGKLTCASGTVCSGGYNAADLSIHGEPGQFVTVTIDSMTELRDDRGHDMAVHLLPISDSIVLNRPQSSFAIGGTISLTAEQPAGNYAGRFSVTLEYQ